MINTVNIDLSNNSCWGTTNAAGAEENSILLCIKLLDTLLAATDIQLEFTKPDGVIVTTEVLSVNNEQINYEIPFNLYVTEGALQLRILATNYTSDYIIFNVSADYIETDDICVKYNTTTQEFSINKCEQVHTMQVIDNLTSKSVIDALSANQGRVLNEKFDNYIEKALTILTDLNDTSLQTGFYYANNSTLNIPYESNWFVQVFRRTAANITQILYRYRDNIIFVRHYNTVNPEGWKDWEQIALKSDVIAKDEIQAGKVDDVEVPASSYNSYEVTFPTKFSEAPIVVATTWGNYNIICQVSYVNTTGFTVNVRSLDETKRTGRRIYWIAMPESS